MPGDAKALDALGGDVGFEVDGDAGAQAREVRHPAPLVLALEVVARLPLGLNRQRPSRLADQLHGLLVHPD